MGIEKVTSPLRGGRRNSSEARMSPGGGQTSPNTPRPMPFAAVTSSTSPPGGGDKDILTIARSWIGTPYVHQASVKGAGCDCLGLLRGVWRELHGAEPESAPPYSPDWAEATGEETLYRALSRHLAEIEPVALAPGDIALFRMARTGPAKHCGVIALKQRSDSALENPLKQRSGSALESPLKQRSGSALESPLKQRSDSALENPLKQRSGSALENLTLIHARQNKRVSEEAFTQFWRRKLAYAFRI